MIDVNAKQLLLEGERIYLRRLMPEDVGDDYCTWMNDSDVMQYLESRFCTHTVSSLREYVEARCHDELEQMFAIVVREGDVHIGNIKIGPINVTHKYADVGVMIGDKDSWGKGYATESIRLIVDYAFNALNLNKIAAGCYAVNSGSQKAFEKAGFVAEGLRKRHYQCNGEYVDAIMMGCLNPALESQCGESS